MGKGAIFYTRTAAIKDAALAFCTQMAIHSEGGRNGTQMVDFEKDTLRWWFSPRSWLWNSMRDSIASSTEPIWIRAILRSFLLEKGGTVCF